MAIDDGALFLGSDARVCAQYMSPAQEACNAASMLVPTAVLVWYAWQNGAQECCCSQCYRQNQRMQRRMDALVLGACMHMPVSIAYHASVAIGHASDERIIDNDLRRLDQSMLHVASVLFAYGISGSPTFAAANVPMNAYGVWQLWRSKATSNDGRRWMHVAGAMAMYTLPILCRGDVENYALATLTAAIGGTMFVPSINRRFLRGWGHTLFHLSMGVFSLAMARATSKDAPLPPTHPCEASL